MEEAVDEDERMIWKSDNSNSLVSATIGRVMTTLLSCRPKKLEDAISRLSSSHKTASLVSMEDSLWCLHNYVGEAAAAKNESLDQILVPMIEHSLKYKESKHGCLSMILLNWLFQDELIFQVLATGLADIISRKKDRYISLGWCILVRGLVDYETSMKQYLKNGIRENYNALLKILCSCIPHLSSIVCNGSILQDGFELPTRLSVSAADCILALSEALTKRVPTSEVTSNRPNSSKPKVSNQPITLVPAARSKNELSSSTRFPKASNNMEMESLLWDQLDDLMILMQRLLAWSRKSRPLHAKGLEQVDKWLKDIKGRYGNFQDEAGSKTVKTGVLLLYSCWKHYGMLLHLEDHKFSLQFKDLLDQYLSGLQFYTDNYSQEQTDDKDSGIETRNFFLNCLCLLLGRSDNKHFESTMSEYGLQIARVLLSQLHNADEAVIDGVVCIFKAVIFKMNHSSGSSAIDTRQLDAVLPLLLHFLDERDGTARAAAMLIAEYCSIRSTNNLCLHEVLKRVASGKYIQRRNALDVIAEFLRISSDSVNVLSESTWQDIANHLLECLGDEELIIREKASDMLPMMAPSLVLPALVRLVYSSDERLQSFASNAIIEVLKYHKQKFEVICVLLDCLSNLSQSSNLPETSQITVEGLKLDTDRVLRLVPEWSKTVLDWNFLVEPLIDKMFMEPSNATMVRFLSYISDHLAEAADVVLHCVLLHMKGQKGVDESFSSCESRTYRSDDSVRLQHSLFDRLCPLLLIRLLPLRVFNDLNSSMMYGRFLNPRMPAISDNGDANIVDDECIAAHLLDRAFCKFEFEDVRKLAAELCGRIHPQVLLPVIGSQLEHATDSLDVLKIKACLFSVCTSLAIRGEDSALHPIMLKIRKTIEIVLTWPSLDGDEVSKAQHGCIDCLALMICAELQAPKSLNSTSYKISVGGKKDNSGDDSVQTSVLSYVIYQLTHNKDEFDCSSILDYESCNTLRASALIPFRLCMANVLISACQKILDSGKKRFARKTIPCLINSVEVITESEIRSACVQVLFSAVYHLKSAVLPHASDLLKLSLKSLKKGSEKEKMAGAKLMASLMASEGAVVESISSGLLEAISILSSISLTDPSPELQEVCKKLLVCITSPGIAIL